MTPCARIDCNQRATERVPLYPPSMNPSKSSGLLLYVFLLPSAVQAVTSFKPKLERDDMVHFKIYFEAADALLLKLCPSS